jgi:hypothetical protein
MVLKCFGFGSWFSKESFQEVTGGVLQLPKDSKKHHFKGKYKILESNAGISDNGTQNINNWLATKIYYGFHVDLFRRNVISSFVPSNPTN